MPVVIWVEDKRVVTIIIAQIRDSVRTTFAYSRA